MRPVVTLELSLLDVRSSRRVASELLTKAAESDLVADLPSAMVRLVSKVLAGRQGGLVVSASETGAAVKVDGTLIGTTPLEGRSSLPAGPHLLQVEKDGYVAAQKEVRIAPDQVHEETLRLVPSPDTIAAYESRATKMRVGAWVTTVLAAGGVGAFIGFQARASALYGAPQTEGTFEHYRAKLLAGEEDARADANRLKAGVATSQTISLVSLGVGAAAAAVAAYLWIAGDDPGKYGRYKELRVVLAPSLGGVFALVRWP
jgi:hypothetical protein